MTRPALGKAEQTRKRILDAAAVAFAEKGYAACSLGDIAKAVSMKPGSLYFHFDSKDALIGEVVHEGMTRSLRLVRTAVDELKPDASCTRRLAAAVGAHVDALGSLPTYAAAVLQVGEAMPAEVQARYRLAERRYVAYWNNLIAASQGEGAFPADANPRLVRRILFGAMNSVAASAPHRPSDDDGKRTLLQLFGLVESNN